MKHAKIEGMPERRVRVEIESDAYVPFEPRTEAARDLRARLRAELRALRADPGEILHAAFAGRLPQGADVENALFYNLNAAGVFDHATTNGIVFELDPTPPRSGVRYSYALTTSDEPELWEPACHLASFHDELPGPTPPTLADVWWALRTGGITGTGAARRSPAEPFSIAIQLFAPVSHLGPVLIKRLLDGIITGLQYQTGPPPQAGSVAVLAAALGESEPIVMSALVRPEGAVLGGKRDLLAKHGRGIKWNPDDDRCVAASIRLIASEHWAITGSAATVQPQA